MTAPRSLVLLAALVLVAAAPSAQLIAYDGFGNGPRANLAGSSGGTGWSGPWSMAGDNLTKIAGPGLAWPGLLTTPGAAVTPVAGGTWPNSVYTRAYAVPPAAETLYVSFLLRWDAVWGMWGGTSFGTYPQEMTVGAPLGWYLYGLMLSEGLGDATGKDLVQGETTLVVCKITRNAPAPGVTYRLYLDPIIGTPEPGFADASCSAGAPSALPGVISIDNGTGFTTDELRLGTTWASVLPPAAPVWTDVGNAKTGSFGRPILEGSGPLTAGTMNHLDLVGVGPSASMTLVFGTSPLVAAFKDGVMVPQPQLLLPMQAGPLGSLSVPFLWPAGVPAGTDLWFQFWIQDPGASHGLAASNGVLGQTP